MFGKLYYCTDTEAGYSVADYHAEGVYFTFTFGPFGVTEHNKKITLYKLEPSLYDRLL